MKITTEILPHINVKELNVWITSQFDYVGIAVDQWDENRPFKITVPFGKDQIPNIHCQHYELMPLKCNTSDPDYESVQQCNVNHLKYWKILNVSYVPSVVGIASYGNLHCYAVVIHDIRRCSKLCMDTQATFT